MTVALARPRDPTGPMPSMQQSFRVLLVEDDDSLRVCIGDFLADHGWSVSATGRGDDAIRLASQLRFDFSILDFHLPGGATGLDVFRAIRRIRPLPAILMSGAASREEASQAEQAGFFTFLRKPLELDCLRQSVQQLIQHHFGGPLGLPEFLRLAQRRADAGGRPPDTR